MTKEKEQTDNVLRLIDKKLQTHIESHRSHLGSAEVVVQAEKFLDFFKLLKLDSELAFNMLISVTATDWLDERDHRFEVIYHLLSTTHMHRIRVKVLLPEDKLELPTLVNLWSGANFMEREVYDMYGVKFLGHPDLRRILMYDEFEGYPLRKDYPLQGKQPRIELRSPEVENTARLMSRPSLSSGLVQINRSSAKTTPEKGEELVS